MTMAWTNEQRLDALMRLPWTITISPSEFGAYLTAVVAELPDAIATGDSERMLAKDVYGAIRASLAARLEFGDDIPAPSGSDLPWANDAEPRSCLPMTLFPVTPADSDAWRRPVMRSTGAFKTIEAQLAPA